MSYKITIIGEAYTKYPHPEELHGIDCEDCFSEYFEKGKFSSVKGGYMDFVFEDGKLMTRTVYTSTRDLSMEELEELGQYTQGQWSDGIGEGFEQYPCREVDTPYRQLTIEEEAIYDDDPFTTEVYISPWKEGQKLIITQVKV